jgi:hypothetical protein
MLAVVRRARYGYLLALHILLSPAAGLRPTTRAAVLFRSRSSVYRTVHHCGGPRQTHKLYRGVAAEGRCRPSDCTVRLRALVADVTEHLPINGPWPDNLSDIHHAPVVTASPPLHKQGLS